MDLFSDPQTSVNTPSAHANANAPFLSVSEISSTLKRLVEGEFAQVRVRGEIFNFRGRQPSGHAYFALKDQSARLDVVVWRPTYSRLELKIEDGLDVIITGKLTVYAGRSTYQLVASAIEYAGIGALMQQLEERKQKLAALGLFESRRKKTLPFLPQTIGLVTAEKGAVIRDMIHRIGERCPAHILLWPVRVQGQEAETEVARAIRGFNAMTHRLRPDVLIVARGGGSIEDLWAFNGEEVVHAVAESSIPVVSGVGHETDVTLIDFAADLRAPTPSAAAECVTPVKRNEIERNFDLARRLRHHSFQAHQQRRTGLVHLAHLLAGPSNRIALAQQHLDLLHARLSAQVAPAMDLRKRRLDKARPQRAHLDHLLVLARHKVSRSTSALSRSFTHERHNRRTRLDHWAGILNAVGYKNVLRRGFVFLQSPEGEVLTKAERLDANGADFAIVLYDGRRRAKLVNTDAPDLDTPSHPQGHLNF